MNEDELIGLYNNDYDTELPLAEFCYNKGRADREKELSELPNEYSEKLWENAYERGRADKYQEIVSECMLLTEKQVEDIVLDAREDERAKVLDELKPFFDEVSEIVLDWICDDISGEFINPQTDESWCAEHCHNGTDYECIKKWCEFKRLKSHK